MHNMRHSLFVSDVYINSTSMITVCVSKYSFTSILYVKKFFIELLSCYKIILLEMGINPMKWKTRNVLYTILTLFIFYVLFVYKKKHHVLFEGIIKNSNPIHVWEFVADFSNMKKLNPTMYVKYYTSQSFSFSFLFNFN